MNRQQYEKIDGTMSSKFLRTVARSLRAAIEEAEEEGRFSYAQTLRIRVLYIEHELRARSRGIAECLHARLPKRLREIPVVESIAALPWVPKEVIYSSVNDDASEEI